MCGLARCFWTTIPQSPQVQQSKVPSKDCDTPLSVFMTSCIPSLCRQRLILPSTLLQAHRPIPSTHLGIRKIHLRVALLKLLQHLQLALLVARRLPHLLLPLIIHHLLHHPPRLPVQIPQLAVLRLYLGGVQEVRGVAGDGSPPLLLVGLVEVDGDVLAGGGGLKRPGGFGRVDLVGEGTLLSARRISVASIHKAFV